MSMDSKRNFQQRTSANGGSHPTTSGKAITSLVLGLLSLFGACLTGIPGLILGIIGLGRNQQKQWSRQRSWHRSLWNRVQQPWNCLDCIDFLACLTSLAPSRNSSGERQGERTG